MTSNRPTPAPHRPHPAPATGGVPSPSTLPSALPPPSTLSLSPSPGSFEATDAMPAQLPAQLPEQPATRMPLQASEQASGPPPTPSPSTTPFTPEPCLTLTSPTDVLAAVPYLVGFHPSASLIVVGLARGQVKMVARWGLPFPPGTLDAMSPLFGREGITEIVIIGYGPGDLVTPAVDEARRLAAKDGVRVGEALRAHEGRYWSYVCDLATCCPAEGTPYDLSSSQIAAEATVRGLVALPNREALERTLAPVTGPVRLAMRRATSAAIADFQARVTAATDLTAFTGQFVSEALTRVHSALETHSDGGRLNDAEAARLGLDLTVMRVRDEAWTLMDDSHALLWKDLTRRLEPRFIPPVASLLAMAAWRSGNSVQATIALERALTADPAYSMANLLMHALQNLLSPTILQGRLPTPAELDKTMGPPCASWLLPLINLLDEEDPLPALE
ncbi:DUF4192 domain-containing protein [Nonomuraea rubra]|uniref:DUF4192 domain-containing protein n=2 Tax=Nonomuraea rubra TaxID=46180 RepID=A0A7X0NQD5_9ACTN|nr:DUF4192 domain-containing protein [Nonomuraea rubra]MBB6547692.1 hypothetical protein [Nonomuraea rubra]